MDLKAMAGRFGTFRTGSVCLLLFIVNTFCSGTLKLNVPKLLLPYYSHVAANFTLEATEGCLIWQSTRPDIASIFPINPIKNSGCSLRAVVTPTSRVSDRKTAVIVAEDVATGKGLRCDVIVDRIVRFDIQTTTKELYLDDSPEEFSLVAYNDKGDVFSSLENMEFVWNLLSDQSSGVKESAPNKVLRILKFSESTYMAPDYIKSLEREGKRGNMVLLRGMETGAALVHVRPVDDVYKNIDIMPVKTIVVANLQLTPGLVYVLPHGVAQFTVQILKQGKSHDVAMPSSQYYLELDDHQVARLDVATTTVHGLSNGFTELRLKEHNTHLAGIFREPASGIHVVSPGYLEFSISPQCDWVLRTGAIYQIEVFLYDENGHRVYISPNMKLEVQFPPLTFEVINSTTNGSHHLVRTISTGSTVLQARLDSLIKPDGEMIKYDSVEGSQTLEVLDPTVVTPRKVILPYGNEMTLQFKASGGTGKYTWRTDPGDFGSIDSTGRVKVTGHVASAVVRVEDASYPSSFFDVAEVSTVPVLGIEFLEKKVEVQLESTLEIPIKLFSKDGDGSELVITKCDDIPFDISASGVLDRFAVVTSSDDDACAAVIVTGVGVGHSELYATVRGSNLTAVVMLAVYDPLELRHHRDWVVLTPGSSFDVVLLGGVQPWVLDPSQYFRTVKEFSKSGIASYSDVKWNKNREDGEHAFTISCFEFGEEILEVTVGNRKTDKNRNPAVSKLDIRIFCSGPQSAKLISDGVLDGDLLNRCSSHLGSGDLIPINVERNVNIELKLYDESSREFDDFSSLVVRWEISDASLGRLGDKSNDRGDVFGDSVTLIPTGLTGVQVVTAVVKNYGSSLEFRKISPPISANISFKLVQRPTLSPSMTILYNHPDVKGKLLVSGGSGDFSLTWKSNNDVRVGDVKLSQSEISIFPLDEGMIEVHLVDLCLPSDVPVTATVVVSEAAKILLDGPKKMPLGGKGTVSVEVMDSAGNLIPSQFQPLMGLQFDSQPHILSVTNNSNVEFPANTTTSGVYKVNTLALGRASLVVAAPKKNLNAKKSDDDDDHGDDDEDRGGDDRDDTSFIVSNAIDIEVFAPLRVVPEELKMTPGTIYQIQATGGPQPGSSTEFFTIDNSSHFASITADGLLSAVDLGTVRVGARSVGGGPGVADVYSENVATISIVELTNVKIVCPIRVITIENEMPLTVIGTTPGGSSSKPGTIEPFFALNHMRFDWSLDDSAVATLKDSFASKDDSRPTGRHLNFAVRFSAVTAGQVTVTLKATDTRKRMVTFIDSVTVKVVESLKVTSPMMSASNLLMMPSSEIKLRTNLDDSNVKYSQLGKSELVQVDDSGVFRAGSNHGKTTTLVQGTLLTEEGSSVAGIDQVLAFVTLVKSPSYLMIEPSSQLLQVEESNLPVGHRLELRVGCHDDVGDQFHSVRNSLSFQSSRIDSIQVSPTKDNHTLMVTTVGAGYTILKVYDIDQPSLVDYIGIRVSQSVEPSSVVVTSGSVVCFSSLYHDKGERSHWSTNDVDLIRINNQSGVAVTWGSGIAHVVYSHSFFTTKVKVTILPIVKIAFCSKSNDDVIISNAVESKLVKVLLIGEEGVALAGIVETNNCSDKLKDDTEDLLVSFPYECVASFPTDLDGLTFGQVFDVAPFFDRQSGHYYCKIASLSIPSNVSSILANLTSLVQLTVSPVSSFPSLTPGMPRYALDVLTFRFLPAFHVVDSHRPLSVSCKLPEAVLRIRVPLEVFKQLEVKSVNRSLISLSKLPAYLDGTASYFLALNCRPNSASGGRGLVEYAQVVVTSGVTGQKVEVQIKIFRGDKQDHSFLASLRETLSEYYNWFFYGLILIFSGISLSLVYPLVQNIRPGFATRSLGVFVDQRQQPTGGYVSTPCYGGGSPRPYRLWTQGSPNSRN